MEGKLPNRSNSCADAEGNIVSNTIVPWTEEEVREIRNNLLTDTDYLALVDNTMTDAVKNYRKALRDISSQVGFPNEAVFPIKPRS